MLLILHILIMDVRVCVRCEAEKGKGNNTFGEETEEWTAALLRWPRWRERDDGDKSFLVSRIF